MRPSIGRPRTSAQNDASERLDLQTQERAHEFLDHYEQGLALETMADALAEADAPITDDERDETLGFVAEMRMDGRVARALAACPRST